MIGVSMAVRSNPLTPSGLLVSEVQTICGSLATSLVLGEDLPDDGALWPARIGVSLIPLGAGRPTIGSLYGRRAPVFAVGAAVAAYVLPTSQVEYWATARYDGALPFVNFPSVVGGPGGTSPRIMGANGTSSMLVSGTVTRDGSSTLVVDAEPHLWRSVGAATADDKHIGAYYTAANNWKGPIGLVLSLSGALSSPQSAALASAIGRYNRSNNG